MRRTSSPGMPTAAHATAGASGKGWSGLTDQQAGQGPPPHRRHWLRQKPALVSSPKRIVSYGNAADGHPGNNQVGEANSSMRTDDPVAGPV